MDNTIWVAIISFAGTIVGSLTGILTANKLTNYRIQKLEEKVDKHNTVIERTYVLEGKMKAVEEDVKELKSK